ncbi:histone-lysine N-methyltransferase SETMAR [Trichonephila clavata]|uniref:Histone-lysine N-methyltransferase SETMAR n=1 Tax=Trichonephila clavata TaxID=2740835 RepID=A0A8X6H1P5_TRICU|nr:histone-lysine N-methyltransferase SETMAR [Trichonephila clavata]
MSELKTSSTTFFDTEKMSARWVPRQLTSTHQEQRMVVSLEHLVRYHEDGNDFLFRIVTGDEMWVHHFTPESKAASMEWKHPSSPVRKKLKTTPSAVESTTASSSLLGSSVDSKEGKDSRVLPCKEGGRAARELTLQSVDREAWKRSRVNLAQLPSSLHSSFYPGGCVSFRGIFGFTFVRATKINLDGFDFQKYQQKQLLK